MQRHEIQQIMLEAVNAQVASIIKRLEATIDQKLQTFAETHEQRVQVTENLIKASVSEALNSLKESWEARAQTVFAEARAYTDEAAHVVIMGLRAQERRSTQNLNALAELSSFRQDVARLEPDESQAQRTLMQTPQNLKEEIRLISDRLSADYNQQLRNVESRLEFVRREIFYELQATILRSGRGENQPDRFEPKIKVPEKLQDQLASGLRLNVGCGHIALDGYINVDRRDLPGVDIIAEATAIPVAPTSATEIIASHLVEHFSLRMLEDVLLPHWRSLLAPGGQLTIVAPDGAAMLKAVSDGGMSFEAFREVLFGAQEYDGDFHLNLVTTETITASLQRAGFGEVEVDYHSRPNGLCYEFRITAK